MEITGHTMVWGQTGVETRLSLIVHVLKVQVEGLNYLGWSRTIGKPNLNFKMQRVPISTCFLARLRSKVGVSARQEHACYWEDYRINGGDFVLKRSHSFGFERSSASAERMMVTEPATTSSWQYHRGSFWSKRLSPFGSLMKARVFSFKSTYRGGVNMKSSFFHRKFFFPLTEPSVRFSDGSVRGSS
ncbi:unnamed protein product [Prunus armeniaca]|uniref:Uncharacterized protein n=2 Tax=Prunus armeniaca TaxID=36596 RepID=A0A6J5UKU2_PRUAR|nr:unnamed protein product [Prunus armeniaca]